MEDKVDYVRYWLNERHALDSCFKNTIQKYPESEAVLHQVHDLLGSIASLTKSTPDPVVNSDSWKNIVSSALEARVNLCRALDGKSRYSALYGMYAILLQDLQALANPSKSNPAASNVPAATPTDPNGSAEVDGFRVPRRRKRISSGEQEAKKKAGPHTPVEGKTACRVENRNYFAPLSTTPAIDCAEMEGGQGQDEQQTSASPGRPPPVVLTTPTNLLQLQKDVKGLVKRNFEF
jgi:hypothetical protein